MRPPIIGLSVGVLCVVLWFLCGDALAGTWIVDVLSGLSTPVAICISKITGIPLHGESAIYIYAFYAIPVTLLLLGLLTGFIYAGIKAAIERSPQ